MLAVTKDDDNIKKEENEEDEDEEDKEETPIDAKRRRRWERDPLHQGRIVQRAYLKGREYQLDLKARLGQTQVITQNTPLNQQAGYYCNICDCILRDSQSYLDHINGKWHNRALGMSMRVERSTKDQILQRLEMHKEKKNDPKTEEYIADGFENRVLAAQQEEERRKEEKRERKREKRQREQNKEDDMQLMDPSISAMMGFSGFGGK